MQITPSNILLSTSVASSKCSNLKILSLNFATLIKSNLIHISVARIICRKCSRSKIISLNFATLGGKFQKNKSVGAGKNKYSPLFLLHLATLLLHFFVRKSRTINGCGTSSKCSKILSINATIISCLLHLLHFTQKIVLKYLYRQVYTTFPPCYTSATLASRISTTSGFIWHWSLLHSCYTCSEREAIQ